MLIFYLDLTKRSFSVVCWSWNRSRVLAWNVAVLFCATHSSSSSNNIQDEYQISTDFLWSARNIVLTARVHKVKTTSKTHHPNHDCRFHFPNFDQLPGQINKQIHTYMETRKRSPRKKPLRVNCFPYAEGIGEADLPDARKRSFGWRCLRWLLRHTLLWNKLPRNRRFPERTER